MVVWGNWGTQNTEGAERKWGWHTGWHRRGAESQAQGGVLMWQQLHPMGRCQGHGRGWEHLRQVLCTSGQDVWGRGDPEDPGTELPGPGITVFYLNCVYTPQSHILSQGHALSPKLLQVTLAKHGAAGNTPPTRWDVEHRISNTPWDICHAASRLCLSSSQAELNQPLNSSAHWSGRSPHVATEIQIN